MDEEGERERRKEREKEADNTIARKIRVHLRTAKIQCTCTMIARLVARLLGLNVGLYREESLYLSKTFLFRSILALKAFAS